VKTSRQLKIALVFLLLGPLLAYVAILPLAGLHAAMTRDSGFGAVVSAWVGGLKGIKGFYLLALLPAAVTTIAALLLSARKDAEFILGSAAVGGLICVVLTNLFGKGLDLPVDGAFGYAFVGAVAAGLCALISRR
jgi:hypothetical protein